MDGGIVSRPKLVVVRERRDLCVVPRRKGKTAASQRPPGRAKDGLLIMCFESIEILVKRLRVDGRCAKFWNTFDKRHWRLTLEEDQPRCNRRLTSLCKQNAR